MIISCVSLVFTIKTVVPGLHSRHFQVKNFRKIDKFLLSRQQIALLSLQFTTVMSCVRSRISAIVDAPRKWNVSRFLWIQVRIMARNRLMDVFDNIFLNKKIILKTTTASASNRVLVRDRSPAVFLSPARMHLRHWDSKPRCFEIQRDKWKQGQDQKIRKFLEA